MMFESKIIDEKKQGSALLIKKKSSKKYKKEYIESYGCQMNFSDSEIVASILQKIGYETTRDIKLANLILINTCSIRGRLNKRLEKD